MAWNAGLSGMALTGGTALESRVEGGDVLTAEVVRVPVQAILYLQAMAENGYGDQPKPLGHALPSGHVCYRQ